MNINGTNQNDTLDGTSANDTILGRDGDDTITGGAGTDTISAGNGNDVVILNAGDAKAGETLDGGAGDDTLRLTDTANLAPDKPTTNFENLLIDYRATIGASQLADFTHIDGNGGSAGSIYYLYGAAAGTYSFAGKVLDTRVHFQGSSGGDTIIGSSGDDWLSGGTGADHISAGTGNDTVYVAAGDAKSGETLDGGADDDTLRLADTADLSPAKPTTNFENLLIDYRATINTSQLADFARIDGAGGSAGSTYYLTGANAGTYDFSGKVLDGRILFTGSGGKDTIVGTASGDFLAGGAGSDTVRAGGGNDTVYLGVGDAAAGETLDGGDGDDTLRLGDTASLFPDKATVNFENLLIDYRASIGASQLADFSRIEGNGGSEGSTYYLTGAVAGSYNFTGKVLDSRVQFQGSTGNDTITGSSTANWLGGGAGVDQIKAGGGNDTVYLGVGDAKAGEQLDGGDGTDTLRLGDTANLGPDKPTINFETLQLDYRGTVGANQLADFARVEGNGGSSGSIFFLSGNAAGKYDFTGKVVDTRVHFTGSTGKDTIVGSSGNDWLGGGGGGDVINGGDGIDYLSGGLGADALTGGAGEDVFGLVRGELVGDSIKDFTGAKVSGGDVLELSGFGSGATLVHDGGTAYSVHSSFGVERFSIVADGVLGADDYRFV